MEYLLKASAVIIIFYAFYKLVLQRETFFQSNRWFLFAGILSATLIPLIVIPIYVEQTPLSFQNVVFTDATINETVATSINWIQIISLIYIAGVIFFGSKFFVNFLSLGSLLLKHSKQKNGDFYLIETQQNINPFSFFNFIVYNPNKFKTEELKQIIIHEKVHAYQYHSIDILLSQIATILFWFNPIVWLYKKELEQNLEFIADDKAQQKSACEKSYQQLLLKTSITKNQLALTNNFYNSLIKKRIIMLHKNRSKNTNQIKYALILPLIAAFIFTFNTKVIAQAKESKAAAKVIDKYHEIEENVQMFIITKDTEDADFEKLKKDFSKEGITAKFRGIKRNSKGEITAIKIDLSSKQANANYSLGSDDSIKPIKISFDDKGDNIAIGNSDIHFGHGDGYSFITKDGNHEIHTTGKGNNVMFVSSDGAKVHVKEEIKIDGDGNHFIVMTNGDEKHKMHKDGKVIFMSEDGNKTVEYIVNENDDEHVWIDKNGNKTVDIIKTGGGSDVIFISDGGSPLYIIDGEESTEEDLKKLNPDEIKTMDVIKGDAATKKYGDKGKNGVVEITTKKE